MATFLAGLGVLRARGAGAARAPASRVRMMSAGMAPLQLDLTRVSEAARQRNADPAGVFVCTGASRGLGLEFARQMLARTAGTVVGVVRSSSDRSGIEALRAEYGAERLKLVEADLADAAQLATLGEQMEGHGLSRVDVLVNTAGILHGDHGGAARMPERSLAAVDPEWMMETFRVNTMAPLLITQSLAPLLKSKSNRRDGAARPTSIVANLSARVGSVSDNRLGGWYSYRISKAALNMATRNLALELKRQGTMVIALHPGTVATGLSEPFQGNVAEGKLFTPAFSVGNLLAITDAVEAEHSGDLFAWDGQRIPF